jgi:predicted Zn-dependent protease
MEIYNKLLLNLNSHIKSLGLEGAIDYKYEDSRLVRCGRDQISANTKQIGGSLTINLTHKKKSIARKFSGITFDQVKLISEISEMSEALALMPTINHLKKLVDKKLTKGNFDFRDPQMEQDKSKEMVEFFKQVKESLCDPSLELSGSFSLGSSGFNYIDTTMINPIAHQSSDFSIEAVIKMTDHENKELRASQTGDQWQQFDLRTLIDQLKEKIEIKKSTQRINIEPGKYNIIFGHEALSEMAVYMSSISLYGESLLYKTGMLDEKKYPLGTKVFDSKFTLTDDPNDTDIILKRFVTPTGLNRAPFNLINKGILKNIYYSDSKACDKFDKQINNDFECANFKIAGGDGPSELSEIIAQTTEPTIYISFIHYMNFTNRTKGEFTGSSRFGTFLIEDCKIKNHLYNLRINDSYFNIFNNIEWLSKELAHTSQSSSYGLRWPLACTSPRFTFIKNVNISASSFQK